MSQRRSFAVVGVGGSIDGRLTHSGFGRLWLHDLGGAARVFVSQALRILTQPSKPNRRARGECRTLRAVGCAGHDQLILGIYDVASVAAEECAAHDLALDEEVGALVGFENANALWTDGGKHGIAVSRSPAKTRNPGPTKFAVVEPDHDMVTF